LRLLYPVPLRLTSVWSDEEERACPRGHSTKPGKKNAIDGDASCCRICIGKMQPVPDKAPVFGREVMFVFSVVVDNNNFRGHTILDNKIIDLVVLRSTISISSFISEMLANYSRLILLLSLSVPQRLTSLRRRRARKRKDLEKHPAGRHERETMGKH
jgi:hypothetical protein